jgi:hypothetical protein
VAIPYFKVDSKRLKGGSRQREMKKERIDQNCLFCRYVVALIKIKVLELGENYLLFEGWLMQLFSFYGL